MIISWNQRIKYCFRKYYSMNRIFKSIIIYSIK